MALVERLPTSTSEGRLGSLESLGSPSTTEVRLASAARNRRAPDRAAAYQLMARVARHPFSSVLWKVCGIALLLLGLSAIGAYATLRGTKRVAVTPAEHAAASLVVPGREWLATQPAERPATYVRPSSTSPAVRATEPLLPERVPGLTSDGKVILNLASVEDLQRLPGIGRKRAEAILALREKLGKFRRPTDLLRVRGLGPKRLKQILPHLVVDPPKEAPSAEPSNPEPRG